MRMQNWSCKTTYLEWLNRPICQRRSLFRSHFCKSDYSFHFLIHPFSLHHSYIRLIFLKKVKLRLRCICVQFSPGQAYLLEILLNIQFWPAFDPNVIHFLHYFQGYIHFCSGFSLIWNDKLLANVRGVRIVKVCVSVYSGNAKIQ